LSTVYYYIIYDVVLLLHTTSTCPLFLLLFHHHFYLALREEADSLSRHAVIRPYIDRCKDSRNVFCDNALSLHRLGCFAAENDLIWKYCFQTFPYGAILKCSFQIALRKRKRRASSQASGIESNTDIFERILAHIGRFSMEVVDRCGYGKCKFFKIVKIIHFESKS